MNTWGVLYVVATPIGNLGDFSSRAIHVLNEVDFIAAEDTRVTAKLLNHFDIKKHLVSCQKYNEKERTEQIIMRLKEGESCAFCSDAGTPVISDPGGLLVSRALDEGIKVVPISGPSAVVTALSVCGIHCERFCFEGFLPTPKGGRKKRLEEIQNEKRTLVFYEAPHKLQRTLEDLALYLGDRRITVCREMTKVHEEIWRTSLGEAIKHYNENPPKGEFVLIVEGSQDIKAGAEVSVENAVQQVLKMCEENDLSLAAAAKIVAKDTGLSKSVLYKSAIEAKE